MAQYQKKQNSKTRRRPSLPSRLRHPGWLLVHLFTFWPARSPAFAAAAQLGRNLRG